MEALNYEIKKQGLEDEVAVVETGCHGLCALGPIMIVYPVSYTHLDVYKRQSQQPVNRQRRLKDGQLRGQHGNPLLHGLLRRHLVQGLSLIHISTKMPFPST